jgi:hypothetical protein
MNIEGYSVTGSGNGYEAKKAFFADSKSFSIPDDVSPPVSISPVSTSDNLQNETSPNLYLHEYRMDSAFMQVDSQRKYEVDKEGEEKTDIFLQEYVKKEEEDEEEEEDGRLIDYFLKALKGEEEELRMEGNSYMSAEVKLEYYQKNFPGLFNPS